MKTYQWKIVDFHDKVHKSGEVQANTLSAAKAKATKASGIFSRIWSVWYSVRGQHYRDNDIQGRMTSQGLRMLVLEELGNE